MPNENVHSVLCVRQFVCGFSNFNEVTTKVFLTLALQSIKIWFIAYYKIQYIFIYFYFNTHI